MSVPLRTDPGSAPLAGTNVAIAVAELDERDRLTAKYGRRELIRRIDRVLDACELANLHGVATPPASAVELCMELQAAVGDAVAPPETTQEVLDELFRLQGHYLDGSEDEETEAGDLVAEPAESESLDPLAAFCVWLERRGSRARDEEIPYRFWPLLREEAARVVIYRNRRSWRLYLDWRGRLAEAAEWEAEPAGPGSCER